MYKYEKVHFKFAYQVAYEIQEELHEKDGSYIESFFNEILLNNKKIILQFSKYTILHHFIEREIQKKIGKKVDYYLEDGDPERAIEKLCDILWLYNEDYFKNTDIVDKISEEAEAYNGGEYSELFNFYLIELETEVLKVINCIVEDVFYLLFQDREFLLYFNWMISDLISNLKFDGENGIMKSDGVIKRCKYFPSWLKTGVFHRDKGRCQKCFVDLSGVVCFGNKINYDHMIPLNLGGINDPTNIQILCEKCNGEKSGNDIYTNTTYQRFW